MVGQTLWQQPDAGKYEVLWYLPFPKGGYNVIAPCTWENTLSIIDIDPNDVTLQIGDSIENAIKRNAPFLMAVKFQIVKKLP